MSATTADWQEEARDLRRQGLSEGAIAKAVNKARSTVHEAVKDIDITQPSEGPDANGNGHAPEDLDRLEKLVGGGKATAGQQTIDGGEVPPDAEPLQEIVLHGTTPLDFFNAGGKLPNKATIRFVGGKVGLEQGTAFKKGETVHFEGYATVVAATPRDKRDKSTGVVLECELQIQAEIDGLSLTSGEA